MRTATRRPHRKPNPTLTGYNAGRETVTALTHLVVMARPQWEPNLVQLILLDLAPKVRGNDLAIAALRAAANHDLPGPRAIAWRGPHWRDLDSDPPAGPLNPPRCGVCGRREPDCYSIRPGGDDHDFEPPT